MKIMMQTRTYFGDEVLTQAEASRIKFRSSGIPQDYTKAHKKMILINSFFLKTLIPEIFCQPEQYLSEFIVSNSSRL